VFHSTQTVNPQPGDTEEMAKEPVRVPVRRLLHRFPYPFIALALAVVVLLAALTWHINVFELPGIGVIGIEQTGLGEILIAFLLVIPAFSIDRTVDRERADEGNRVSRAEGGAHRRLGMGPDLRSPDLLEHMGRRVRDKAGRCANDGSRVF